MEGDCTVFMIMVLGFVELIMERRGCELGEVWEGQEGEFNNIYKL